MNTGKSAIFAESSSELAGPKRLVMEMLTERTNSSEQLLLLDDGNNELLTVLCQNQSLPVNKVFTFHDSVTDFREAKVISQNQSGSALIEVEVLSPAATSYYPDLTSSEPLLVVAPMPKAHQQLAALAGKFQSQNLHPGSELHLYGRNKHLNRSSNLVLEKYFQDVFGSLGKYNSRVIIARQPKPVTGVTAAAEEKSGYEYQGVNTISFPGVFSAEKLDQGSARFLSVLENYPFLPSSSVLDLGCGNGILSLWLKKQHQTLSVTATDVSRVACLATAAAASANNLQIETRWEDAAAGLADESYHYIVCNPPFHNRMEVSTEVAFEMFRNSSRLLKPGGELLTVFNSHLNYRSKLEKLVGETKQLFRDAKFTITVSEKPK